MKKRIVMKFGGTSVGGADAIRAMARQVQKVYNQGHEVVVVVSAMRGVTDALIDAAVAAQQRDAAVPERAKQLLWEKHHEAAAELLPEMQRGLLGDIDAELSNLANLLTAITVLGELTPRALDYISSLGERFNALLIAAFLSSQGCPSQAIMADQVIVTDATFGNANPLLPQTRERAESRLLPLIREGGVPVVTGFLGATEEGIVTTLGRGGSDYTASILGHALDAEEIWVWSDVDGVLTADPRIVSDAHPIDQLSYKEAAELAYYGAKVLHPKTVRPAVEKNIPLRMLNTFNPEHPGTWIVQEPTINQPVKAVTAIRNLAMVTIEGRGMLGIPGVAARVFHSVAELGVSVLMISQGSSEQSICFVVPEGDGRAVVKALEEAFRLELVQGNIDRIVHDEQIVIVALVGVAMRGTPGIAGRLFTALGGTGINVLSIAQGSSEHNLSLVVHGEDAHRALQAIHDAFELGKC